MAFVLSFIAYKNGMLILSLIMFLLFLFVEK